MRKTGKLVLMGIALFSLLFLRYAFLHNLAASMQDEAPALVWAPEEAANLVQRALWSFKQLYPQYDEEIAISDDPDASALHLTPPTAKEKSVVSIPTLLGVDPLTLLTDLQLAQAHSLLATGEDSASGLQLVPALEIHQRGYARLNETAIIDYAERGAHLRLLAINGVEPSLDSLQKGTYPLTTPLAARLIGASSRLQWLRRQPRALVAFVDYLASVQGQKAWYGAEDEVSFLALGDVMLARNVGGKIDEFGITYPFELVRHVLDKHDIVFANLESPIGIKGTPIPNKLIWFRARPEAAQALTYAGLDIVSLANNHILDYDSDNLIETLEILDGLGIARAGAGRNLAEARRPALITRNGITVALLAYTEFASEHLFWSNEYPRTFLATAGLPGCAPMDLSMIVEDVQLARQQADIVMVTYHWGQEYINHPAAYFEQDLQKVGRQTIDAGADAVFGTHPHAIQGIEFYQGKPIAYSLGNFVMDQYEPISTESMMLSLDLTKQGLTRLEVIPVRIADHRPAVARAEDANYLLDKIRSISLPLSHGG